MNILSKLKLVIVGLLALNNAFVQGQIKPSSSPPTASPVSSATVTPAPHLNLEGSLPKLKQSMHAILSLSSTMGSAPSINICDQFDEDRDLISEKSEKDTTHSCLDFTSKVGPDNKGTRMHSFSYMDFEDKVVSDELDFIVNAKKTFQLKKEILEKIESNSQRNKLLAQLRFYILSDKQSKEFEGEIKKRVARLQAQEKHPKDYQASLKKQIEQTQSIFERYNNELLILNELLRKKTTSDKTTDLNSDFSKTVSSSPRKDASDFRSPRNKNQVMSHLEKMTFENEIERLTEKKNKLTAFLKNKEFELTDMKKIVVSLQEKNFKENIKSEISNYEERKANVDTQMQKAKDLIFDLDPDILRSTEDPEIYQTLAEVVLGEKKNGPPSDLDQVLEKLSKKIADFEEIGESEYDNFLDKTKRCYPHLKSFHDSPFAFDEDTFKAALGFINRYAEVIKRTGKDYYFIGDEWTFPGINLVFNSDGTVLMQNAKNSGGKGAAKAFYPALEWPGGQGKAFLHVDKNITNLKSVISSEVAVSRMWQNDKNQNGGHGRPWTVMERYLTRSTLPKVTPPFSPTSPRTPHFSLSPRSSLTPTSSTTPKSNKSPKTSKFSFSKKTPSSLVSPSSLSSSNSAIEDSKEKDKVKEQENDRDIEHYFIAPLRDGHLKNIPEGISAQDRQNLVEQTKQAVTSFHQLGLINRDIKPENLLFKIDPHTGKMLVTLNDHDTYLDFIKNRDKDVGGLRRGAFTVHYNSPESYYAWDEAKRDKEYTVESDLWSTGIVTFGILTGSPLTLWTKREGPHLSSLIFGKVNQKEQKAHMDAFTPGTSKEKIIAMFDPKRESKKLSDEEEAILTLGIRIQQDNPGISFHDLQRKMFESFVTEKLNSVDESHAKEIVKQLLQWDYKNRGK